jgi:hypothetical protein
VDRLDRVLGGHHRRGAHFEHLEDVRRVAGAERGDRGGHRLRIAALVDRVDLVVALALVEALGQVVDAIVVRAGHRVPPLDLGDSLRRCREAGKRGGERQPAKGREDGPTWVPPEDFRVVCSDSVVIL